MSFEWGRMLWFLLLVPLLVAAYVLAQRRRRKYALRFSSLSVVKEALGTGPGLRRHVPPVLFITAIAALVVAMARPSAVVVLPSQRATVILTMDVSGSMQADDVAPTRIQAAQAAARAFVSRQPANQRIGVVTFAESAAVVQSPTTEHQDVLAAIDRLRTYRGTAIGRGIMTSLDTILEEYGKPPLTPRTNPDLGRQEPDSWDRELGTRRRGDYIEIPPAEEGETYPSAVVVLLSDGQSNTGPDPIEVADRVADRGVKIYTIGLGSPDGTVLRVLGRSMRVRLDEEILKRIAEKTGGSYFRAETDTDLRAVYESLGTRLVLESKRTEITAIVVAVAALLLLAAGALSLAWFARLP